MNILLNRLDDRLIHGQVLVSWVKRLAARRILVIDDDLARDSFSQSVFALAAPRGVQVEIAGLSEGLRQILEENDGTPPDTILLCKEPRYLLELFRGGYRPASVNIGCLAAGPSRKRLSKGVFLSEQETELFEELIDAGIPVFVQPVYAEAKIDLRELIRR